MKFFKLKRKNIFDCYLRDINVFYDFSKNTNEVNFNFKNKNIKFFKKFNNKYFFIRQGKKIKKIYNKKNYLNNNLEKLVNVFLKEGKKKKVLSYVNTAIYNFYDIFFNPDYYYESLIEEFEEYPNYHEIKKLFSSSFNLFSFSYFYPIFFENYKLIFDLKNVSLKKKKKNKKLKIQTPTEFKYIYKLNRLKHLMPIIKSRIHFEDGYNFQERFFIFFSHLAIQGKNDFFLNRKINIYSKLLKLKNKNN